MISGNECREQRQGTKTTNKEGEPRKGNETGNEESEGRKGTKMGNQGGEPRQGIKTKNGEQNIRKDKDGKKLYPVSAFVSPLKKVKKSLM